MDPPVSDPRDTGASPAETAAADPPEDPPGTHSRFQGLLVFLKAEVSVEPPMANSSMLVLPIVIIPASISFWLTVDS